ncbi:MAG: DUF885 domain-containing protein [Woeseiaceae bacterium]|nr:DUF885 domain-containing protein [Woeseiaceae bacterium]
MLKRLVVLWALLFAVSCGGSGGGGSAPAPGQPPASGPTPAEQLAQDLAGLTLAEFYETSYGALLSRSPESVIWLALTSVYPPADVALNDLSDSYRRETFDMYEVALTALEAYDTSNLSADEKLTYDFYEWYLQDVVDSREFIYYDFAATYNFNGVQSGTERFFTSIHPVTTIQEADEYVARLGQVSRKFDELSEYLGLQSGAGIIEPRITLDAAVFGLGRIADAAPANVSYYTTFSDRLNSIAGLPDAERQRLLDAALAATRDSVIPAYRSLRTTLQGLRGSAPDAIGVGQYSRGSEYYDYILRHHTTTDLTAAEIHQLGLDELQRIHAEMRQIFDQLGYPADESLIELFNRVSADGGVIPAVDVKSTYEGIIQAAEANVHVAFDIFPSANVVVADDPFGGFYIGPSFDGTRPGAFYAGTQTNQPWFQMPSLSYHEAVPGHHTQIAIAMELPGPTFRKTERFTGFVEGWALYAERLAWELGWYTNDPYGNLGRLQYEALRAARLVIDTGIHSLGWNFEQAVVFNMANVGWNRGASESAAGRYSVVPGQATAYLVGMLHMLDTRQRAMDQLGTAFDLTEFHRVVLTSGGVPLALLDEVVDAWIADKLAQ